MAIPAGDHSTEADLLELAASDQVALFRIKAAREPAVLHIPGQWYGRCPVSSRMTVLRRTALMVAAAFGSLNVLQLILSFSSPGDVDRRATPDGLTALHCAIAGASPNSSIAASLLLNAGADPNCRDARGRRPIDLIPISLILSSLRSSLQSILRNSSPPLTPSSDSTNSSSSPEKKKNYYPIDTSIPDIQSSIYSSDEFRMFSFKIKPCSRAYSHDWTECPFVHPGENARRRDPRRFDYSCTPCAEFRRGLCPNGDLCEFAHGVFESWLHPALYRTRLCKDGELCTRRVCFFAHSTNDLRFVHNCRSVVLPHHLLVRIPHKKDFFSNNSASPKFQSDHISRNSQLVSSPNGVAQSSFLGSERERIELKFELQEKSEANCLNLKEEIVGIEPDISWVQSLVGNNEFGKNGCFDVGTDEEQAVLGHWMDQMQLNQKGFC